ncbi:hypothetical protein ODJ79_45990 [Actinoplanes sp. KI2]|uniref:hypothetical protein n=1 Tax=Actinoplanes sp. KI2 TaxID=2983315 RepID=UPI0021D58408|nr:hypothetical protein [Actinoplanes sp. KI2]MCU7731110.1 hypothetical protein [Actinoplanes sp. KI2]
MRYLQRAERNRLLAAERRDRAAAERGEGARLRAQAAAEHQPDREQLLMVWERPQPTATRSRRS